AALLCLSLLPAAPANGAASSGGAPSNCKGVERVAAEFGKVNAVQPFKQPHGVGCEIELVKYHLSVVISAEGMKAYKEYKEQDKVFGKLIAVKGLGKAGYFVTFQGSPY